MSQRLVFPAGPVAAQGIVDAFPIGQPFPPFAPPPQVLPPLKDLQHKSVLDDLRWKLSRVDQEQTYANQMIAEHAENLRAAQEVAMAVNMRRAELERAIKILEAADAAEAGK